MSLFEVDLPPGLIYVQSWLSTKEQDLAVAEVDSHEFETTLTRRVQHFGARYDYFATEVLEVGSAPEIPPQLQIIGERLFAEGYFAKTPDQVIVNEYLSDQGIAAHIDRISFGPAVATVSLLESWPMQFAGINDEKIEVLLESRSLAVMTNESRYKWTHGIAKRKSDPVGGLRVQRKRRLSLTYRTILNTKL